MPTPTVILSAPSGTLFEGESLILTCTATLPPSVDTDVTAAFNWMLGAINDDRVNMTIVESARSPFKAILTINQLMKTDAKPYSCEVTVTSSSHYITESSQGSGSIKNITVINKYGAANNTAAGSDECSVFTTTTVGAFIGTCAFLIVVIIVLVVVLTFKHHRGKKLSRKRFVLIHKNSTKFRFHFTDML